MAEKPVPKSHLGERELDRVEKEFKEFDQHVNDLTIDRMNQSPKQETEPQTKLSQQEISHAKDIYLKPVKSISATNPFNEKFREAYNFDKEFVQFIVENKECIGDDVEIWTRKYAGVPAEFWNVPTNKPVWGPRYLAEQIKECSYHRLSMQEAGPQYGQDRIASYHQKIIVDSVVQRIDALPVSKKRSIFMGSGGF